MQFDTLSLKNVLNKEYDELEIKFKVSQEFIFKFFKSLENPVKTYSVVLIKDSTRRESFYDTESLEKEKHVDIIKNVHESAVNRYAKIVRDRKSVV